LEEQEEIASKPVAVKPVEVKSKPVDEKKKASFKEKQEYEKLQAEIEKLEARKTEIASLMIEASANHSQLQKLGEEVKVLNEQIDTKTLRWLELAELL
jgi:ATP-binding cassette subfamily F protein uup